MPETMTDVFDILEPSASLDAPTIGALRSMLGDRLVSEIGAMTPKDLAPELITRREEVGLPATVPAGIIAKALLDFMQDMGFMSPAPSASLPTEIKLITEKSLRDMNLRELLELLAANPGRYSELVAYIDAQPQVRQALLQSPNWAVTVAGQDGKLDVDATLDRVDRLINHSIVQPTMPDGRYPTLFARVFGQDERFMLNPFARDINDAAVRGPIFRAFDLGNLPEVVHLAFIWTRFIMENGPHPAWPGVIDLYEHLPQAFAEKLEGRWLELVQAYEAAKRNGDPTTESLTRYISPEDLRSRRPFGGNTQQRDESWYKQQLEQRVGRGINQDNSSVNLGQKIVRSVKTTNSSITLNDTIVLGSVSTTNGRIKGRFYVLHGAYVGTTNNRVTDEIYEMSHEGLYNKAVELGLISE